jgi:hypothetical protein
MIVYYNKTSGKIYGAVLGRVHSQEELDTFHVQPKDVPKEEINRAIFDIEATKEFEKQAEEGQFKILDKKVVVDAEGKFLDLADKDTEPETKPDAVETIIIDLTKTEDEIYADFSETTRRLIRNVEKQNYTFREIGFEERDIVYNVLEEIEDLKDIRLAKHILTVRASFLDGVRRMYVVENEQKEPLAVALITIKVDSFVYTLGGVTVKGRDTHAGYLLVWGLIRDAKSLGFKTFDLGGIYADWADDDKKKVNQFKQRWGGKVAPLDVSSREKQ